MPPPKSAPRAAIFEFIRNHRWLPPAATAVSVIALFVSVALPANLVWIILAGAALLICAFVWGYSAHAFKQLLWAPLEHLRPRQYAQVWDTLAASSRVPEIAASGVSDEAELFPSTSQGLRNLLELAGLSQEDEVLEVGCGAGRIGLVIAPRCKFWTGADLSVNMLSLAAQNLKAITNVKLVQLKSIGLPEFPAASFDLVYITSVLGHLDEMDRWRYAEEAFRVLRPAGRLLLDNVDIESEAGWAMFANDAIRYRGVERPPYMPRFSTAAELTSYTKRAGFEKNVAHHRDGMVIVIATKSTH